MHRISEPTSHYQCLRSNKILYEARKVIFQNDKDDKMIRMIRIIRIIRIIRMIGEIR
jgi:hypothetical protein